MNKLGPALDQILTERGISQSELARRLDVTASAVNQWARGRATPSRDNIVRIEDELAVEPRGSLLALAGYTSDDSEAPTVESLIRADPTLDPEDRRVILRIIRMARERFAQAFEVDMDDPDERELWSKTSFSEEQRRGFIVALRQLRAESARRPGTEISRGKGA